MASIFGHTVVGTTLGKLLLPEQRYWRWWLVAAACAFLPDADVLGFKWHVAYGSLWGHRGLTHSVLAALVVATCLTSLAALRARNDASYPAGRLWLLLSMATASHGILDAMTTGGLGVAFFSPFDTERYFLNFRPIAVSPIGVKNFAGEWAGRVLRSEVKWVALPCAAVLLMQWVERHRRAKS
ncbi:metal-dependent hydrolase [Hymenobacter taeanensis]|uniref:Metal-dependent hydrolase n=1 Tax=Hymenobacter taeanensis TaxID=2735321 RepID=A0A6M6BK05_9BACT|nr:MULTISPECIES: metal-dependent hydrolase [Hymenobacter]QJX48299.1 metal-dependent hydrolase [Hymenobacter taeanensis]UOQ82209.1 metal-dependent hydrolase [Hymenobacter sp. 5414T-23]